MPITRASRAKHANRTLLLNSIKFAFGCILSEFLFLIAKRASDVMTQTRLRQTNWNRG